MIEEASAWQWHFARRGPARKLSQKTGALDPSDPNLTSENAGVVRLLDFKEDDEPLFVLDRAGSAPHLASISAGWRDSIPFVGAPGTPSIVWKQWRLHAVPSEDRQSKCSTETKASAESGELAVNYESPAQNGWVLGVGDGSWLRRTPIIVQQPGVTAKIIFWRVRVIHHAGRFIALDVKIASPMPEGLKADGGGVHTMKFEAGDPALIWDKLRREDAYSGLRAVPVLVEDVDADGCVDVIIPHPRGDLGPVIHKLSSLCTNKPH